MRTHFVAVLATSLVALAGCSRSSEESTAHAQQPGGDSTYDATAAGTDMNATGTAYGAESPTANPEGGAVPADNTGVNERDRNDANLTPEDQSQSAADLDLVKRIRQSISADDSLSANAKNVKVITRDGMVTLRGPVKNEQERKSIEEKATLIAGAGKVSNLLEVVP
jgi:hypothetical protein